MYRQGIAFRRLLVALLVAVGLAAIGAGQASAASVGLGADWVANGSGEFNTWDSSDRLRYRIEPNAVDPAAVEFKLEATNSCMWRKVLNMPDGLGNHWDITIDPTQGTYEAANGLWADQVHNGQHLELWKAGFLGINRWVLNISHLGGLQPGSRVVFTWLSDGGANHC